MFVESVRIEEIKHQNLSQLCLEETTPDTLLRTEMIQTLEAEPENVLFTQIIQLSLFGNSSKINSNVKLFKGQPSLQSLCSLVPNQPAPKRGKKGEFMFQMGANNTYTATDPYETPNI